MRNRWREREREGREYVCAYNFIKAYEIGTDNPLSCHTLIRKCVCFAILDRILGRRDIFRLKVRFPWVYIPSTRWSIKGVNQKTRCRVFAYSFNSYFLLFEKDIVDYIVGIIKLKKRKSIFFYKIFFTPIFPSSFKGFMLYSKCIENIRASFAMKYMLIYVIIYVSSLKAHIRLYYKIIRYVYNIYYLLYTYKIK